MPMKAERLVLHLSDTARKIGYRVRSEEGNFRGGSCVFAEERLIILNRRMSQEERAELLGRVLAGQNLDGVFLLPEVRAFIEKLQAVPGPGEPAIELPPEPNEPPANEPPAPDAS
jgi:hypothetical protein